MYPVNLNSNMVKVKYSTLIRHKSFILYSELLQMKCKENLKRHTEIFGI